MRNHLIQVGEALYGPRFQRELAEALGVNERTMRRWVAGDFEPPASIEGELNALVRARIKRLTALLRA
jgi:DNA-binding XRE family transcriptional regulator